MKRLLILFVLNALLVGSVHAYLPLLREGMKWVTYYSYEEWDYEGYYQCYDGNYVYEFSGDTTVNQTRYKKLYQYWLSDFGHFKPHQHKPAELLREEGHKVYIWDDWEGEETLLYDFDCPTNANSLKGIEDFVELTPLAPFEKYGDTYSGWSFIFGEIEYKVIEGIGFWGNWGDLIDYPGGCMFGEFHTYYTGPSFVVNADNHVILLGMHYRSTFDVNHDGAVDGGDVNALINTILGTDDTFAWKADINDDGSVDAIDLNLLIEVVLY